LGLYLPSKKKHIILGLLAIFTGMFFVNTLAQWNKMIPMPQAWIDTEEQLAQATKAILNIQSIPALIFTIFYIGILPGICEELFFRGCLQHVLIQNNPKRFHLFIWITAFVFALIHTQMQTILPRIFLGAVLGYLYYYSGSLWVSIIAHIFNNAFQVVLSYFVKNKILASALEQEDFIHPAFGIFGGILCIALVYIMFRSQQKYNFAIAKNSLPIYEPQEISYTPIFNTLIETEAIIIQNNLQTNGIDTQCKTIDGKTFTLHIPTQFIPQAKEIIAHYQLTTK
jgi:membrane protease YdiL (CAAX protease family)